MNVMRDKNEIIIEDKLEWMYEACLKQGYEDGERFDSSMFLSNFMLYMKSTFPEINDEYNIKSYVLDFIDNVINKEKEEDYEF